MLTINDAERAAEILVAQPEILGVELFGSVARDGVGNDLDMIVIASEEDAARFTATLIGIARSGRRADCSFIEDSSFDSSFDTDDAAVLQKVSFSGLGRIEVLLSTILPPHSCFEVSHGLREADVEGIDLFCFPSNWKSRLDELQALLPHKDPNFMRNIAGDAKVFQSGPDIFR